MKKTSVIIALLVVLFYSAPLSAQDKGFGAGLILGEPTGISAKFWLNNNNAFVYGLGASFVSNGRLHMHVDYVWHNSDLIQSSETIVVYYGPGIRVRTVENGKSMLGIRGVAGAAWFLKTAPFDIFAEIVPVLNLTPDVDIWLNLSIGGRYFFN